MLKSSPCTRESVFQYYFGNLPEVLVLLQQEVSEEFNFHASDTMLFVSVYNLIKNI